MSRDFSEIQCRGYADPTHGAQITRLTFRGWIVDVDRGEVTIPRQRVSAGKAIADLAVCVQAAHTLARKHQQRAPSAETVATPSSRPESAQQRLAAVLRAARDIAEQQWRPVSNDVYACTRQAWEDADMNVPYAALLRALRAVLPAGTNLMEFNDEATGSAICALYDRAITRLLTPQASSGGRGISDRQGAA